MLQPTMQPELDRSRSEHATAFSAEHRRIFVLLICGFALITVLLGLDAWVGYHGAASVRTSVSDLTENQLRSVALIGEVQRAQSSLSSIQYRLPGASSTREREELKNEVDGVEELLQGLFARVPASDPEVQIWNETRKASFAVTAEADRILRLPIGAPPDLAQVTTDLGRLSAATSELLRFSRERAAANRQQIERATQQQSMEDRALLLACLIVAGLFLRTAVRIYRRMGEQAEELSVVSWQLLEKQESLARRFSRDLHDELGQTLTALKTNFSRHSASPCVDAAWMQDCTQLLKESIQSAHEISQLLRPTLLDDFGLDSALAWLCERFEERHQTRVSYASDIQGRLEDQTETHIFRIAQEALTNIARHANASHVRVTFAREGDAARLEILDNGIGLPPRNMRPRESLGLTGMKARARSLEGKMHIHSKPGRGTLIDVTFPWHEATREEANSHLVG